jgi:hypothetical protein
VDAQDTGQGRIWGGASCVGTNVRKLRLCTRTVVLTRGWWWQMQDHTSECTHSAANTNTTATNANNLL